MTCNRFYCLQDKAPLLVLPGGPGLPASYLEPLELMAGVGRQVIFYDQVGSDVVDMLYVAFT
jgi:hypothetical protein